MVGAAAGRDSFGMSRKRSAPRQVKVTNAVEDPHPVAMRTDEFFDTYVSWREECEGVRFAYSAWRAAVAPDRSLAFAVYGAALDREDRAAERHAVAAARLAELDA